MKHALLLAVLLASCTPIPDHIRGEEVAFEVMMASAVTNYSTRPVVGAAVFPFTQEFIRALGCRRAVREKWSDSVLASFVGDLKAEHLGEASDTLTLLLFLHNSQWPCTSPVVVTPSGVKALIPPTMMPCAEPYIGELWRHVYLENEKGVKVPPRLVSPPRHETLTTDETIWCKFQVGLGAYKWIDASREVAFVVDIKPETIRLKIK